MTENTNIEKCENCGTDYNLKTGSPEICWICGLPTKERLNLNEI